MTIEAAGPESLVRLTRFAEDFSHKHDHVAFNFFVDGMMDARVLPNLTRPQLVDLVNDAICQKIFVRQEHQWLMRNTGETVTVQALVLNCDHADVIGGMKVAPNLVVARSRKRDHHPSHRSRGNQGRNGH